LEALAPFGLTVPLLAYTTSQSPKSSATGLRPLLPLLLLLLLLLLFWKGSGVGGFQLQLFYHLQDLALRLCSRTA
jgi:hypothetical protein